MLAHRRMFFGVVLCAFLFALASASAGPLPEYQWTQVTAQAAFKPRDGAGALVFKGHMWLIGGWNPKDAAYYPRKCVNDVWRSSDGATWTRIRPNTYGTDQFQPATAWEGRHTAGYVVFKDKMWIVGGDPLQGHYQYDVWNSTDGKTWVQVNKGTDVPWGPRILHYTVAYKGKIWVMGGQTASQFAPAENVLYDDVWNSEDGIHWVQVKQEETHWDPRGMIGGRAVFKDRIWILGGGTYDTPDEPDRRFYNDVWSTADGVHWTCHLEHAPWHPRQYHDVAVFDNRLWVLEGWNKGNRNDVWHSADGITWKELPNTPWAVRHASSLFVHDGALWVVAGNNMESDVWKLERVPSPRP